jgi:outer membrane receptor protein involved in Fe transport
LKLIAQKSVRRNTASQLFTEAQKGLETNTETLKGLELLYTRFIGEKLQFYINGFRNTVDVIAWNGTENITEHHGRLKLFGIEADMLYNWSSGKAGVTYSFINQLDWDLADGVLRSGISFSDYNQPIGEGVQVGVGNDLANWPGHALKFFGKTSLSNQMILHLNSRILWHYQGMKDGLTGLSQAMQGTVDETVVGNAIQQVNAVNTYDLDFRANASLNWQLPNNFKLQLFVINIFKTKGNKRYSYDNGNDDPSPTGVRFIEEPRVFGVNIEYDF